MSKLATPNFDDDNKNGVADINEPGKLLDATGKAVLDDELFPIVISSPLGYVTGVDHLTLVPTGVKLFKDAYRTPLAMSAGAGGASESSMQLIVTDKESENSIDGDSQDFYAFNAVVIVILGEFQVPSPSPSAGQGLMIWAIERYAEGWDVHAYDESDLNDPSSSIEIPFAEIRSAVVSRGVTEVSMIGYSHGAGELYEITEMLVTRSNQFSGFTYSIPFTSYIDGVKFGQTDRRPEDRRPIGSNFHLNQYQDQWLGNSPLVLHGTSCNANIDIDRTYLGVTHTTIDDNSIVLNLLTEWFSQMVLK